MKERRKEGKKERKKEQAPASEGGRYKSRSKARRRDKPAPTEEWRRWGERKS
jgi:hypothetical protein